MQFLNFQQKNESLLACGCGCDCGRGRQPGTETFIGVRCWRYSSCSFLYLHRRRERFQQQLAHSYIIWMSSRWKTEWRLQLQQNIFMNGRKWIKYESSSVFAFYSLPSPLLRARTTEWILMRWTESLGPEDGSRNSFILRKISFVLPFHLRSRCAAETTRGWITVILSIHKKWAISSLTPTATKKDLNLYLCFLFVATLRTNTSARTGRTCWQNFSSPEITVYVNFPHDKRQFEFAEREEGLGGIDVRMMMMMMRWDMGMNKHSGRI